MNDAVPAVEGIDSEVDHLVRQIRIPPCPSILTRIVREMHSPEPDLNKVSQWVAADVGLAAAMLKTVNSPLYGLRYKATSVMQALILLGLHNVAQLITGLLLRQAFAVAKSPSMDHFWAHSAGMAAACMLVARELKICDPNQAYTFGLFRDAGMAAMRDKHASYEDILTGEAFDGSAPITAVEMARYGVTHAHVGAYFGTSWHLNESVWKAILLHHDYDKWPGRARELAVRTAAMGLVAEEVYARHERDVSCPEWPLGGGTALSVLDLDENGVENLREELGRALS